MEAVGAYILCVAGASFFHSLIEKEENMKSSKFLASFSAVALILCAAAFAKDNKVKKSGSFDLTEPAQIGSTLLQPGHYKAEWTGSDDALQVSILENGKTVATTQATLKQLPSKAAADAVIVKTADNNSKQIEEIDFNNRTEALTLAGA
jgi:hypothetical protein